MSTNPRVSVITPTYNRAETIGRAVESLQQQTIDQFEHIIVDDGSTDETQDIVTGLSDERIRYIRLSENQGANTARNRGINESNGDYISFLDSDDEYLPQRLERTIKSLEKAPETVGGVFHAYEYVDGSEVVNVSTGPTGRVQLQDLAKKNLIGGLSCTMFRADVLSEVGGFDESLPSSQDYDLYLRVLRNYDLLGVPEVLSKYFTNENGIRDDFDAVREGQNIIEKKHGDILSDRRISRHHYNRALYLASEAEISAARKEFRTAISIYPKDPLYYYHYLSSLCGRQGFSISNKLKRRIKMILR